MKELHFIITFWTALLLCTVVASAEQTSQHESFVFGQSELGRELKCHRVGTNDSTESILIVFGLHGFKDAYDHDGKVLQKIAESIIAHYSTQPENLKDFCLYIVPMTNPDGMLDGKSEYGFGRCNAAGLDINRDFPVGWTKSNNSRNRTGNGPFSTSEACAIRDLVEAIKPTYGIDVHGWIHATYGDGMMAKLFAEPFSFSVRNTSSGGMLCQWLDEVTEESIMIELPSSPNSGKYITSNAQKLIQGIDGWISYCKSNISP